jgi:hypothetical protein
MKAKKPARRIGPTTPFLLVALCAGFGYEIAAAAPTDSISSLGITGSDQFEELVASDLMIVGPVEAVDLQASTIQVLGQSVRLATLGQTGDLLRLALGNVVAVSGKILAAGVVEASAVSITAEQYVAGAQPVFLRGVVSAILSDVGILAVGKLSIDYTAALYSLDASSLSEGGEFVFSGIQAVPNGSALALSAAIRPNGITGSDVQGIAGSDVQGITGSDVQGIAGSDVQGIAGSDVQGIAGSDVQGIAGSDVQGIAGSDVQGIAGSDVQGIAGSDVQGIAGSDVQGIAGSDVQGIAGSDVQGIAGSDVQGIAGSDLQGRGITGSDLQGKGITGSDLQGKGITGSDLQGKGITGSDLQGKGITGSDLQSRGIAGSDSAGIAGSDF